MLIPAIHGLSSTGILWMEMMKCRMSFALVECHVAAVIGGGAFVGWEIGMGGPGSTIQSV